MDAHIVNNIFNIAGGFEQTNLDTVKKIITLYHSDPSKKEIYKYLDLSYSRIGQDIRYALNDDKLRMLGWEPKMEFDNELPNIINYYKNNFIW